MSKQHQTRYIESKKKSGASRVEVWVYSKEDAERIRALAKMLEIKSNTACVLSSNIHALKGNSNV